MPKQVVHTFQGGMVKDLDKSLITKERYLEARNFRLLTSTGESTGALENIEGNNNIAPTIAPAATLYEDHIYVVVKGTATYDGSNYGIGDPFTCLATPTVFSGAGSLVIDATQIVPYTMYVAGSVYIRDTIVLFLTTNTAAVPTGGHNMIVKFTLTDSTEVLNTYSVLFDDTLTENTTYRLMFSTANPIRAVATYETPNIQKVYWCDGFNNIKYANIADYLTTDGLVKSGANYYFPIDMFEFLPETSLVKPVLDRLYPGNITAGTVQYAYQYYTEHGSETTISPLSNTIHITTDDDYKSNDIFYYGEGDITTITGKSIRMTFNTAESDKFSHIRIIRLHYQTVNSVPTITIVGEMPIASTSATVSYLDTGALSYGTLTIDEFNLGETELFGAKDLAIKSNRLFAANINKEEFTIGDWDARAVRFKSGSTATVTDSTEASAVILADLSNWVADYTADHDGINGFNNPANDGNAAYAWKYQKNGSTLGAEGPNIKIGFATDTLQIDDGTGGHYYQVGIETVSDNKSFTNFSSPYIAGRRSWQRDEIYRLYMVFFDAHGRSSSAKWVCDLRMPSLHDTGYEVLGEIAGSDTNTTVLYPTVELNSFPTGAVSAQLLRVERHGNDRSVLTQGLIIPMSTVAGTFPKAISTVVNNSYKVKMVSPEINILKNIAKGPGDYIEYVTNFTATVTPSGTNGSIYKLRENNIVAFVDDCKSTINDTMYVEPRAETDIFVFYSSNTINYNTDLDSYSSSGLLINHDNAPSWTPIGVDYVVANYKRNVHASQYGGYYFESREGNIAIPASDVIAAVSTPYTAYNGDTFINWFDVTTQLSDLTKATGSTKFEAVYVPLESSINCDLRHDISFHKAYWADVGVKSHLMQEVAGQWENFSGETFDQQTSLYQYNTVYSQDSTAKFYINIPSSVSVETDFDCMVKVSKTKINGESQDSFTLFPINDFIEVATNKGAVTTIESVNDKLLFWQENAFGLLSVNERSLVQDSGGAALVLGTGGVLDRYDYISESIGATDNQHVIPSQTGVYWINTRDRSMYRFTQNLQNISKSKLIQSWFEAQLSPSEIEYNTIRMAYDTRYNHVLVSFYNSDEDTGETLVFDETIDTFAGFYDYYTTRFIPHVNGILSVNHQYDSDLLFYHNSQLKERCCFYSYIPSAAGISESTAPVPAYVDSSIKVLFNDDYGYTKVFDNLSFVTTATLSDVEIYNNTFNTIRCYNNYQNTDTITLTYGTNLERDEREWTTFVPRNAVDKAYSTNPDIFSAANLDTARTFKERIRDKYMITDFTYTNTSNRRFVVPYVTVNYRLSPR